MADDMQLPPGGREERHNRCSDDEHRAWHSSHRYVDEREARHRCGDEAVGNQGTCAVISDKQ